MADSRSRVIVNALMDQLMVVRGLEETEPHLIKHAFGNLEEAKHGNFPRLTWVHMGGRILEKVRAPEVDSEAKNEDGTPVITVPAAGFRRSDYKVAIWAEDVEKCEQILDQLVTAALLLPNPDQVVFENQSYEFPTEESGRHNDRGELIYARIGIRSSVPAKPLGGTTFVEVLNTGQEFRAGIENPVGEPLAETGWDVDRIDPDVEVDWEG